MPTYLAKVSYHDSTFLPSEKILIKWRQQSAALDYVESMSHKIVFDPHLKGLELGIQEQAEKEQLSLSSIGQHPIIHSITIMNKTDFKQTKKVWKFLLFSQKRSSFKFISKTCKSRRKAQCYSWYRLSRQNFGDFVFGNYSWNFVSTFNPRPESINKVSVELNYFDLVELEIANAEGIVNTIKESIKRVKINYKLFGFSSDGASVYRGHRFSCSTLVEASTQRCI